MHQRPFPTPTAPHRERLHHAATIGSPVTRFEVEMHAMQAIRAMITMGRADATRPDGTAAVSTIKRMRFGREAT